MPINQLHKVCTKQNALYLYTILIYCTINCIAVLHKTDCCVTIFTNHFVNNKLTVTVYNKLNMCVHKLSRFAKFEIDDFVDNCEYEPPGKRVTACRGDMKILHHNIRGLNSKLDDLKQTLSTTLTPDLILLSETWLKSTLPRLTCQATN